MTNKKIIILSICAVLAISLLIVLLILIFRIKRGNKNKQKLESIWVYAEKERMKKIEIIFQRLSVVAKTNNKFTSIFEELTNEFDKIESAFTIISKLITDLTTDTKGLSNNEFNDRVSNIEAKNEVLEDRIRKFRSKSNSLLKEEEFLRNEMSFCREKLRIISDLYSRKRLILDKISDKIDDLNNKIKIISIEFDRSIEKGDNEKASELMSEMRDNIILFAIIINEGPKIQATIYGTIPTFIKKLIELFKRAIQELKVDLIHINFKDNMQDLSEKYKEIVKLFQDTQLEECKEKIISAIKSIKALERNINSEIKARNLFIKNYQSTIKIIKKVLKQYVEMMKEKKEMPLNGRVVPVEITDCVAELKPEINILDESAIAFEGLFNNQSIPYTSRLSRMKIILNRTISISKMIGRVYELIWEEDLIKQKVKNRFLQIEQALISLRAQTVEKRIMLTTKEQIQLDEIYDSKRELKVMLGENPFNPKLSMEKADYIIQNTTSYYRIVGGKIEMANMVNNLMKEFSSSRALDSRLNVACTQAEQSYLAGKYAASLNLIIEGITELKYSRKKVRRNVR